MDDFERSTQEKERWLESESQRKWGLGLSPRAEWILWILVLAALVASSV